MLNCMIVRYGEAVVDIVPEDVVVNALSSLTVVSLDCAKGCILTGQEELYVEVEVMNIGLEVAGLSMSWL
jgi:hypothetical protein